MLRLSQESQMKMRLLNTRRYGTVSMNSTFLFDCLYSGFTFLELKEEEIMKIHFIFIHFHF